LIVNASGKTAPEVFYTEDNVIEKRLDKGD
jgi:hypothetical protein